MSTITEADELATEHATTLAALHGAFGEDAHAMVARIDHRYRTTLASFRRCVDDEVASYMRTRYGAS